MDEQEKKAFLEAAGEFPNRRFVRTIEGDLKIAIGVDRARKVIYIEFDKRISWLAYTKDEALALAATITKHAEKL